jgi:hypothetical protein
MEYFAESANRPLSTIGRIACLRKSLSNEQQRSPTSSRKRERSEAEKNERSISQKKSNRRKARSEIEEENLHSQSIKIPRKASVCRSTNRRTSTQYEYNREVHSSIIASQSPVGFSVERPDAADTDGQLQSNSPLKIEFSDECNAIPSDSFPREPQIRRNEIPRGRGMQTESAANEGKEIAIPLNRVRRSRLPRKSSKTAGEIESACAPMLFNYTIHKKVKQLLSSNSSKRSILACHIA